MIEVVPEGEGKEIPAEPVCPVGNSDTVGEQEYEIYTKEVVKHRGGSWLRNSEPLPEGWTILNHHCGFPLFFQKEARIVTWSRPYYIGKASVKNHKVPMSAIPCLAYSRRNDEQNAETETAKSGEEPNAVTDSLSNPQADAQNIPQTDSQSNEQTADVKTEIQTVEKNTKMNPVCSVDAKLIRTDKNLLQWTELKDYIKKKFEYDQVQGKRYKDHQSYKKYMQDRRDNRKKIREGRKRERGKEREEGASQEQEDQDLPTLAKTFIEVRVPDNKGRANRPITIYLQGKVRFFLVEIKRVRINDPSRL